MKMSQAQAFKLIVDAQEIQMVNNPNSEIHKQKSAEINALFDYCELHNFSIHALAIYENKRREMRYAKERG